MARNADDPCPDPRPPLGIRVNRYLEQRAALLSVLAAAMTAAAAIVAAIL